jgi:hypothetical protein
LPVWTPQPRKVCYEVVSTPLPGVTSGQPPALEALSGMAAQGFEQGWHTLGPSPQEVSSSSPVPKDIRPLGTLYPADWGSQQVSQDTKAGASSSRKTLESFQDEPTFPADARVFKDKFTTGAMARNDVCGLGYLRAQIERICNPDNKIRISSKIKLPPEKNKETIRQKRQGLLERIRRIDAFVSTNKPIEYEDAQEAVRWMAKLDIETDIGNTNQDLKDFVAYCKKPCEEASGREAAGSSSRKTLESFQDEPR